MGGQEPLGMARRFEALHTPLPFSRWLVRVLRPVIEVLVLALLDAGKELFLGCLVALEFIRHDHARNLLQALQELLEEVLGCFLVALTLHQDVKHMAILIDCPP